MLRSSQQTLVMLASAAFIQIAMGKGRDEPGWLSRWVRWHAGGRGKRLTDPAFKPSLHLHDKGRVTSPS